MRVLVLGGYGLIGLAITRTLHAEGHAVTGLGRSASIGRRLFPGIRWVQADLASLATANDWKALLGDFDVVINAAGTLQDGLRESVQRTHHVAIAALASACAEARTVRLIQISAPDARTDSTTEFMRSKARADQAIKASGIDWVILRPGLVIGANAYGGSALLRAIAAFPFVLPIALPERRLQTVALADLARIVLEAVEGKIPPHTDADVLEDEPHSLREIVERMRQWLGIRPPFAVIPVPRRCVTLLSKAADALGYLGWRSPLRSTAIRAIEHNVVGNPGPLREMRGASLASLDQMLAAMPAGIQERWFARTWLLMPVMVATLSLFWTVSGVVGLLDIERAARTIPASLLADRTSSILVVVGATVDIALGLAILFRPFARAACVGMIVASFAHLVAGSILTPALWLDPLGPFIKVFPSIVLALTSFAVLEER